MSKKKFIKLSEDWTKNAKSFLSNLIEDVLDENELTMKEFCGFIDVEQDEINNFLYNNGELSLLTISKILIGSNLAVEVKHVSDTEIESYGLSGSDCEDEEETTKKVQPRDEKGRFKSYDEVEKQNDEEAEEWDDEEPEFTDFSQLDREELVQIIEENEWDDEIDVNNTPKRKLVKFLEKKENELNEALFNDTTEEEDEKDMREAIRETLDRNPERILKLLKAIFEF
jgi:hypothetical protein